MRRHIALAGLISVAGLVLAACGTEASKQAPTTATASREVHFESLELVAGEEVLVIQPTADAHEARLLVDLGFVEGVLTGSSEGGLLFAAVDPSSSVDAVLREVKQLPGVESVEIGTYPGARR